MNRFKDLSIAALIAGTAVATTSGVVIASENGAEAGEDARKGAAPEVSMEEVISQLRASDAERILESELEREQGRAVYEVEYVDTDGNTREVYINGRDGETVKTETEGDEEEEEEDDES